MVGGMCSMVLVFAIMGLPNIFRFSSFLSIPFLYSFVNLVSMGLARSAMPACPDVVRLFDRGDIGLTVSSKVFI